MKGSKYIFLALALTFLGVSSCQCHKVDPDPVEVKYDHVSILYSVGRNDLDYFLTGDIQELASGNIPSAKDKKVMLVISQSFLEPGDTRGIYDSSPYLIRMYRDKDNVVLDTLKTFPLRKADGTINLLADPETMTETISAARSMFPSDSYGLIFSSHGFGWTPRGYYVNPVPPSSKSMLPGGNRAERVHPLPEGACDYVPLERDPSLPRTKSFGRQLFIESLQPMSLESDIIEMSEALPGHFDYILFDACLMGGIEVAYQFKDVCDIMLLSPAEILTDGLDYTKLGDRLFGGLKPDVKGVAEDYFNFYNAKSRYDERSATVTVVDCKNLDKLAAVCKEFYSKYADAIDKVNPGAVGRYFSISNRCWFYDLESVFIESGITDADKATLESALDAAAPYRAATEFILGFIEVKVYSGFSMYLPKKGDDYLDGYYRTLSWNKATGLVK